MKPHSFLAATASIFIASNAAAWSASESKWASSDLPVGYTVNSANVPSSIGEANLASISQTSFDTWEAPACTNFRTTYEGTSTRTPNVSDRENVFMFLRAWPAEYGTSTLGVTTPAWQVRSDGAVSGFRDADIVYNARDFTWDTSGSGRNSDFQSIATHEQGHFLGLDHTGVTGAIMFPSYSSGRVRVLSSDDIAGVCALYPSGGTAPAPVDPCASVSGSCGDCTAQPSCGWCGASSSCREGSASGPTSGTCASDWAWQASECEGGTTDPCARFAAGGCGECTRFEGCGFCRSSGHCESGTEAESASGACRGNDWVWFEPACDLVPGSVDFGGACRNQIECRSGLCIATSASAEAGFCTRSCGDDCNCPSGYACFQLGGDGSACAPGTNECNMTEVDAGVEPGEDAGTAPGEDAETPTPGGGRSGGCGCATASNGDVSWLALAVLGFITTLRKRRAN
jgi:MYXO-CTERM domain-containing protein